MQSKMVLSDAGCVRSDTLERMASEGKIRLDDFKVFLLHQDHDERIRFLHSTRHYPEWPFVKAAHTDEVLAKQVAIALMSMPADSAAAKAAKCAGWTIPQNYQTGPRMPDGASPASLSQLR